jgi:hypothetical protein
LMDRIPNRTAVRDVAAFVCSVKMYEIVINT